MAQLERRLALKNRLKSALLNAMSPALLRSANGVDVFLARAATVYHGGITQEELLTMLRDFYAAHDEQYFQRVLGYSDQRQRILDSGYKLDILSSPGRGPWVFEFAGLWQRRLHLLRHRGLRIDWLLLRRGQTIPPHAHRGVLSGFMVMEGCVAIKHFHALSYTPTTVTLQPTIDTDLFPGDFTVNAEHQDNVHWLQGLAELSILFRFNAVQLPSSLPELAHASGRMYVDVSCVVDGEGVGTEVPLVSKERAATLMIR